MTEYRYYAVDRSDGKRLDLCESRHEAVGRIALYHSSNQYDITPIPAAQAIVKLPRREQARVFGNVWGTRYGVTD